MRYNGLIDQIVKNKHHCN